MDTERALLLRAARATVVAELVFTDADGALDAVTVTPLIADDRVTIALPYGRRALADDLAAAEHVALVMSDDRMTLRGWEPLAARGRIEVSADPDGIRFSEGLLDQELRKHPPSRILTDSLRDRRDNWWYIPRLLCTLVPTGGLWPIAARSSPTSGVLSWVTEQGLAAETVEVVDADDDTLSVRSLGPRLLGGTGERALLFRHDYSRPDLERRCERFEWGVLDDGVIRDVRRRGELSLPEPPGLLERVRRHRAFSKACRQELARAR